MNIKLKFDKLLVYSDEKCYVANFEDGINIIIGKNTSGKSTLLQSLLYTMGINDVKQNLYELLEEKVIFRLDGEIIRGGKLDKITFIRDDSILIIREGDKQLRFNGINGDNSAEHIKVKEYVSELFGFDLVLESKGELRKAPLETMFLPYYISQAVGWVYLQKSFSNLEFYKNFREDYLDYYLGIVNTRDRLQRSKLEKELQQVRSELKVYRGMIEERSELTASKLADEEFVDKAEEYLEEYNDKKSNLKKMEKEHMFECNKLALLEQRYAVLKKVAFNNKRQNPVDGRCPTCNRGLDFSLETFYEYEQSVNDTNKQKEEYKRLMTEKQGVVNSLTKKINQIRQDIEGMYAIVKEYQVVDVKFEQWVNMKANIKLSDKVEVQISTLQDKEGDLVKSIKGYKTDEEIQLLQAKKEKSFKKLFRNNLDKLGVKPLEETRYNKLYDITSFPSQGVELHKTVMAYHFAFNSLLKDIDNIHRFPFLLDAIFKEDIDKENRDLIYDFIKLNRPKDTQTIFTVAFSQDEQNIIQDMKAKLGGYVKINEIGELNNKRALLYYSHEEHKRLIEETEDWIIEVS